MLQLVPPISMLTVSLVLVIDVVRVLGVVGLVRLIVMMRSCVLRVWLSLVVSLLSCLWWCVASMRLRLCVVSLTVKVWLTLVEVFAMRVMGWATVCPLGKG